MKVRVRFGITLSWPFKNAAILIIRIPESVFEKLSEGVMLVKMSLPEDVAERIVCEKS